MYFAFNKNCVCISKSKKNHTLLEFEGLYYYRHHPVSPLANTAGIGNYYAFYTMNSVFNNTFIITDIKYLLT